MVRLAALASACVVALAGLVLTIAVQAAPVPNTTCNVFPADNIWNTDISSLPVNANSAAWMASTMPASGFTHPDFGRPPYGIPFNVVSSSHPTASISFDYAAESDPGPYPWGNDLAIEGPTDSHMLVVNKDTCKLYETFATDIAGNHAGSGAIFDLGSDALRPANWTSADAAGLPILPGLVRFDEVQAGFIGHAIRFTVHNTNDTYLWPARHHAGINDPTLPPMGARFRLKKSFDISGFGAEAQVVLTAFKHYGLIVADNGSDWYFQGTEDSSWDDQIISDLKKVPVGQFEAVDESSLMVDVNSAATGPPATPGAPVAIGGESSATVYWTASTGAVSSYTVTVSPGGAKITVSGTATQATVNGLTDGSSYTFTLSASNSAGSSATSPPSNAVVPGRGAYQALSPYRIFDSRQSTAFGPGSSRDVQVTGGPSGVPATGVTAVVMNVTVTDTTAAGYLTVWPAGVTRPTASNLNWVAGETVPNLVEVAVGSGGKVSVFNSAGNADVIFDVAGYVAAPSATAPTAGLFNPVVPNRILDTRIGLGAPKAILCANQTITVKVAGTASVPATGVAAVALNVTATDTIVAPSYITISPTGSPRPGVSNLNFVPGQVVANRVIVKLGTGGSIDFYDLAGHADVIADVAGWYSDGTTTTTGSMFVPVSPSRLLDTRSSQQTIAPGGTLQLTVAGNGGVPSSGATAVVLNVTATNPTAAGYLTVWPSNATQPLASDLNFVAGQTVPNLVVVKLSSSGVISIYNSAGSTDVVVDVVGWYG